MIRGVLIAAHLAVLDFLHERLMSLCAVLSLASILAPLLVLAGTRYGIVSVLEERLLSDPAIMTVLPAGSSGGYDLDWIMELRDHPDVAFIVPRTRDIAANIQLERQQQSGTRRVPVDMEPTDVGDPLLQRYGVRLPETEQLVLSASAARKLGASAGDSIIGRLGRRLANGKMESAAIPLTIAGVLPVEAEDKDVAFVQLALLEDAENYRDCIAVPERGFAGDPPANAKRRYGGFRLYAKNLEGVAILRDYLTGQQVEVLTRAREIMAVQSLDRSLTLIFALIASSAGIGFVASTSSSVLASVRRKDKHLAMVRLMGFSSMAIRMFPLVQTLLTAVLGMLVAFAAYSGIALCIDALFSEALHEQSVCHLPLPHLALAFGIVLLLSFVSSIAASLRAARIDPSEVLREI